MTFRRMARTAAALVLATCFVTSCQGRADSSPRTTAAPEFVDVFRPVDSVRLTPPERDPIGRVRWVLPVGPHLVLGDATAADLKVFDWSGKLDTVIGRAGSGPGEFRSPRAAAVLSDGTLAIADDRNSRITIFDSTLARQGEFTFPGVITSVAAAPAGRIAVLALRVSEADVESWNAIHLYDRSGALIRSGCPAPEPTRPMERNVFGYSGALVGPSVVWVSMTENAARVCDVSAGTQEKLVVGTRIYVPPTFPERPAASVEAGRVWMGSQMWVNKLVGVDSSRYIVRFAILGTSENQRFQYVLADRRGNTMAVTGPTDLWIEFAQGDYVYATRRRESGDVWLIKLSTPRSP